MRNNSQPGDTFSYQEDLENLIEIFTYQAKRTWNVYRMSPYMGNWLEGNMGTNPFWFRQNAYEFAEKHEIKRKQVDSWVNDIFNAARPESLDDAIEVIKKAELYLKK